MGSTRTTRPVLERLIVLEGIDGAGTTSQAHYLVDRLHVAGLRAEFTCEPTDLETGRLIRRLLATDAAVDPMTLALLFAADRNEHLHAPRSGMLSRMNEGVVMVCDRYLFSSLAYQGELTDARRVAQLNVVFPLPGQLIFIDTPVGVAQSRLAGRGTSETIEGASLQERVARRYRAVVDEYEGTGMVIHRFDGTRSLEDLADGIGDAVLGHLKR